MTIAFRIIIAGILIVMALFLTGTAYTVKEYNQVVITQFGKPIGTPITTPGLHFKIPFIQKANRFDKRALEWDGAPTEMVTREKTLIEVDTFGRWKIADAKLFMESLQDERRADSRIKTLLEGITLKAVGNHNLIEIVRSTKDRVPEVEDPDEDDPDAKEEEIPNIDEKKPVIWKSISKGRSLIETEIYEKAKNGLERLGIELLDIRFKRFNYNPKVRQQIYTRMTTERQAISMEYRAAGKGEGDRILGEMAKELKRISSEAYKKVATLRGNADAMATATYAAAYNKSQESVEFYEFQKTMELYRAALSADTSVILSTKSDLFRYLKGHGGEQADQ
ncbi:MAG: protease modulator HflC [Verrucomicrobiales bacterium]|nr:protease modulator HflC [Verrucomicrobiales bacterium]